MLANAPKGRKLRARRKAIEKSEDIDTLMEHKSDYSCQESRKTSFVKNGYTFGSWLLLAERLYRRERFLNRNHFLPKQFAAWMKAFGISKTFTDIYKRIYKLVSKAPRLINCQMSVNRFF